MKISSTSSGRNKDVRTSTGRLSLVATCQRDIDYLTNLNSRIEHEIFAVNTEINDEKFGHGKIIACTNESVIARFDAGNLEEISLNCFEKVEIQEVSA